MELGVATSSLSTTSFFLRAEVSSTPIIYAFSSQLQVQVVCGSEIVSVTRSLLSIILDADSSIDIRSLASYFSSSTNLCDIMGYQVYTRNNFATVFSNPSINFDTAIAQLSIDQSVPQKIDLFVRAFTFTAQNSLQMNIVVCGNEQISAVITPTSSYVLIIGDSFTLTDYLSYFTTGYSSSDSH
jgi:hypothetical protein